MNGILRLAKVYVDLCEAGNSEYLFWNATFQRESATNTSEVVLGSRLREQAKEMEKDLKEWQNEMHNKRKTFSKLNHFTAQQLLLLRSSLASIRRSNAKADERRPTLEVYNLLECVLPGMKPSNLIDALVQADVLADKEGRFLKKNYKKNRKASFFLHESLKHRSSTVEGESGILFDAKKSTDPPSRTLEKDSSTNLTVRHSNITTEEFKVSFSLPDNSENSKTIFIINTDFKL